jgi:hypothetical protein
MTNFVHGDTFGSGANTFDIQFVTIGDPGNVADTTGAPNPAGSVGSVYRIGKYETSEQMIDKANALAGLGITKITSGPDKPGIMSWNEAARFVNWLNASTGSMPAYKFALQPGEAGYIGNAEIQLWSPSDAGYNPNNLYRNRLARYFLPSVDEWDKAAYFDPTSVVYYDYPSGSNGVPDGIDFAGDPNFDAVFFDGGLNPHPNDVTNVGLLSPYGTAGQGGNVLEWEETEYDLMNDSSSSIRGVRGGSATFNYTGLQSNNRKSVIPSSESYLVGFRVASNAESILPGGYSHDGRVDAADYALWREYDRMRAGYDVWRAHFGEPDSGSGTIANSAAPELSSAKLAMSLFALLAAARWPLGLCCKH